MQTKQTSKRLRNNWNELWLDLSISLQKFVSIEFIKYICSVFGGKLSCLLRPNSTCTCFTVIVLFRLRKLSILNNYTNWCGERTWHEALRHEVKCNVSVSLNDYTRFCSRFALFTRMWSALLHIFTPPFLFSQVLEMSNSNRRKIRDSRILPVSF